MAIKEYTPNNTIDLSNEDGNVFVLIALTYKVGKQLKMDAQAIVDQMISSTYGNALAVFNREFGDFIDLKLPSTMTVKDVNNAHARATLTPEKMQEGYLK